MMSRQDLDPEQKAAATHGAGPALVLTGPGTGKTTTLAGRYAHLTDAGVHPERVFVSTFTRKTAHELRDRIHRAAGVDPRELPIGTFHSYCFRLTGAPDVIKTARRLSIVRECMPDWKGDLSAVVDTIDRFMDSLVSPEEAQSLAGQAGKGDRNERQRIAAAYACYQQRLAEDGLADFGDLVWQSIRLLRTRSSVTARSSQSGRASTSSSLTRSAKRPSSSATWRFSDRWLLTRSESGSCRCTPRWLSTLSVLLSAPRWFRSLHR